MNKFCVQCGTEFESKHGNQKLCDKCREENKHNRYTKNLGRMLERKKELNLRSASLYAKDIDLLKSIKEHKETLADSFHRILDYYMENKNNH